MARTILNSTRKLSKRQLFSLWQRLTERKYSICATCDGMRIVSLDEANAHREHGHFVGDIVASKDLPVN